MEKIISLLLDQCGVCSQPFVPWTSPLLHNNLLISFLGENQKLASRLLALSSQKNSGEQLWNWAISEPFFLLLLTEQSWWKSFFWKFLRGKFHFFKKSAYSWQMNFKNLKEKRLPPPPNKMHSSLLGFWDKYIGFCCWKRCFPFSGADRSPLLIKSGCW